MKNQKTKEKKVQQEFFTDEMHSKIFVFPEGMSSGRYSAGKPVVSSVRFARMRKNKK